MYIFIIEHLFLHAYTSLCKVFFQFKVHSRNALLPPIIHGRLYSWLRGEVKVSAREIKAAVILGFGSQNKLTAYSCVEVPYANKNYMVF